jgi:hypothetical protein
MIIEPVFNGPNELQPKRENRIRENIASQFISIHHIDGKINLADIFTKEMKDTSHFVQLRDLFMCSRLRT